MGTTKKIIAQKQQGAGGGAPCFLPLQPSGRRSAYNIGWTSSESVKLGFAFIVLTAVRSGEVRFAVWEEIDEQNRLWIIPKERMKAGRPHSVPLSAAAWAVLEKAKKLRPELQKPNESLTGLIFPNTRGGALSDMTFTQVLRRMKVDHTMHGFRASFRTWGAEIAHHEHGLLEFALAHIVGDATERPISARTCGKNAVG